MLLLCLTATPLHAQPVWEIQNPTATDTVTKANLTAVSFCDSMHGTAVGDSGTIVRTSDGGHHWIHIAPVSTNGLKCVIQFDSLYILIAGANGELRRSMNGGATWDSITHPLATLSINVLAFKSAACGVASLDGGAYIFTFDSGRNWYNAPSTRSGTRAMLYSSGGTLIIAGNDLVAKSNDTGRTWEYGSVPDRDPGWGGNSHANASLRFRGANEVWMAGLSTVIKNFSHGGPHSFSFVEVSNSTDGGQTWSNFWWGPDNGDCWCPEIYSLDFVNDTGCVVVGKGTSVYSSKSPFKNWPSYASPVSPALFASCVIEGSHLFVVGESGVILRLKSFAPQTEVDGVDLHPAILSLSQNYPNPVHATSTTINYSLQQPGHVKVSLCDLLGREIAWPVDNWESAGAHVADVDASRLTCGTYLYRIEFEHSTVSRMMVVSR